jgi:hypothetical protein
MMFHQWVRLSRPVRPRVLFLDLFSSHHTLFLYTTLHVAMVNVLTSTRMTLNSQFNSRLMVNRLRIAGSLGAWMKHGTGWLGIGWNSTMTSNLLLVFSTRAKRKPSLDLKLPNGSCCLTLSDSVRNLGVTLDTQLTMERHVRGVCKTSSFHLRSIGCIRQLLNCTVTKALVHAFVLSRLITAMLYLLACMKKLLIVFRQCKIWQRGW